MVEPGQLLAQLIRPGIGSAVATEEGPGRSSRSRRSASASRDQSGPGQRCQRRSTGSKRRCARDQSLSGRLRAMEFRVQAGHAARFQVGGDAKASARRQKPKCWPPTRHSKEAGPTSRSLPCRGGRQSGWQLEKSIADEMAIRPATNLPADESSMEAMVDYLEHRSTVRRHDFRAQNADIGYFARGRECQSSAAVIHRRSG